MTPSELMIKTRHILKTNSPTILTGLGAGGVVTTAYLSWRAGFETGDKHGHAWERLSLRDKFAVTWKRNVPPTISGVMAIGCIVGASRIEGRRSAAVAAAYSVSERAFAEYRDKVAEKFGKGKEQQIRDELVKDRLVRNPPAQGVIAVGPGNVLCCELFTGRYFNSDMETLRRAQNDINAKLVRHIYATLDDFYYMVGLAGTSGSSYIGWDSDRLMGLEFSTVLTDDGRPCLAFEYNYTKSL